MRNSGVELSLGFNNKWGNFGWNSTFVFSHNDNKILELLDNYKRPETGEIITKERLDVGGLGQARFVLKTGGSLGDLYSTQDLVRDANGNILVNNDGSVMIQNTEDIKLGTEKRDAHIDVYCENIRRCAKYGVKCVTYNFMPVFDWTRTQLDKQAADGSTSLVMYWEQMKGLDPLTDDINLPGWDASYTRDELKTKISGHLCRCTGYENILRAVKKTMYRRLGKELPNHE